MANAQFGADDYASAFLALLPTGRVWPKDDDSVQSQIADGIAPTFEACDARAMDLITEAFPSSTEELLPDAEASLGLPDPCIGLSPTIELRRAQVLARFAASGGQSVAYFIAFALTLGYVVTVTEYAPYCVGRPVGLPLCGTAWAHTWQVNAPTFTIERFEVGTSCVGEQLASWTNNVLQCELNRLKPAHTTLLFSYS